MNTTSSSTKSMAIAAGVLAGIAGGILIGLVVLGANARSAQRAQTVAVVRVPSPLVSWFAGAGAAGSSSAAKAVHPGAKAPSGAKKPGATSHSPTVTPGGSNGLLEQVTRILTARKPTQEPTADVLTAATPNAAIILQRSGPKLTPPQLMCPYDGCVLPDDQKDVCLYWARVPGAASYDVQLVHYTGHGFTYSEFHSVSDDGGSGPMRFWVGADKMQWRVRAVDKWGNKGPATGMWEMDQGGHRYPF